MLVEALAQQRPVVQDFVEGGWLSWRSPVHNSMHPLDPLLFELGWRAWSWLIEELHDGPDLSSLPPDYPQSWTFEPT